MNKNKYKEAFSKIQPSDNVEERIVNMTTNRKNFISFKRVLITALVVVSLLCSVGVFANAATDGAVGEAISQVAEKVIVFINGEKTEQDLLIIEEGVGKDGEPYYKGEVQIKDSDGEEKGKVEFEMDGEGAAIGLEGIKSEDIDAIIAEGFEVHIATTVEAE